MESIENGYNGWKNYETWNVALWISNDEGTQEWSLEMARDAVAAAPACSQVLQGIWKQDRAEVYILADAIKEWVHDELVPDLGASMAADLLGAALSEVDWQEIAENWLADVERVEVAS